MAARPPPEPVSPAPGGPARRRAPVAPATSGRPRPRPATFYRAETLHPEQSVGYLMKRVLQSLLLQADRALGPHDLTHAQWLPLYRIARGECLTVAALAREQALDPGAMTRALDRLEAKGLIKRVRSVADRRVVQIELTPAGRDAAAMVPPALAEVLNGHLAGFSRAEWQELIGMLRRMLANGEAMRAVQGDE